MLGAGDREVLAVLQSRRHRIVAAWIDQRILAGGDQDQGQLDSLEVARGHRRGHWADGLAAPAEGGAAQGKPGVGGEPLVGEAVAALVVCHKIGVELARQQDEGPGPEEVSLFDRRDLRHQHEHRPQHGLASERGHGRDQHAGRNRTRSVLRHDAHGYVGPHGMAEGNDRSRRRRAHNLLQEQLEVGHIGREVVDVPLVAIGQGAVGQALAAPVHGEHAIATAQQFPDKLGGVLFDEFAPAGQHHHAAARGSRDVPAGIAQAGADSLKEAVTISRNVGFSQLGRYGRRRGCRIQVNHARRRFDEGGARKPAEIWAIWPSSSADSLPLRMARL